jgi:hypothetical protein
VGEFSKNNGSATIKAASIIMAQYVIPQKTLLALHCTLRLWASQIRGANKEISRFLFCSSRLVY